MDNKYNRQAFIDKFVCEGLPFDHPANLGIIVSGQDIWEWIEDYGREKQVELLWTGMSVISDKEGSFEFALPLDDDLPEAVKQFIKEVKQDG